MSAQNWFSKKKNSHGKQDPRAVCNVLDAMLRDSLERLKTMRSAFSLCTLRIKRKILFDG